MHTRDFVVYTWKTETTYKKQEYTRGFNIETGLIELGQNNVEWINVAQGTYKWRALMEKIIRIRLP